VLIPARYLVDRMRQPRSRADELHVLRRRFAASPRSTSPRERRLASRLRALRAEMSRRFGTMASCRECARGTPWPGGHWPGGHCCSGATEDLFSDDEVAALRQAGTAPRHLRPPSDDHAGCAFRGANGCSLAPVHRPNRCLIYVCRAGARELFERGELDRIESLADALSETFTAFVCERRERLDDEAMGLSGERGRYDRL
jgi:hypothetical protein